MQNHNLFESKSSSTSPEKSSKSFSLPSEHFTFLAIWFSKPISSQPAYKTFMHSLPARLALCDKAEWGKAATPRSVNLALVISDIIGQIFVYCGSQKLTSCRSKLIATFGVFSGVGRNNQICSAKEASRERGRNLRLKILSRSVIIISKLRVRLNTGAK